MSYPHELPDLTQRPADFRRNMANFSAFISDTMTSVTNLNKKLEDLGLTGVSEREYLDKSEVEKMLEGFAQKEEVDKAVSGVKADVDVKIKPLAKAIDLEGIEKSVRSEVDKAVGDIRFYVDGKVKPLAKASELKNTELSLKSELDESIGNVKKDMDSKLKPLAKTSEINSLEKDIKLEVGEIEKSLLDKIEKLSNVKHLTIQDVKSELKDYELTKSVNAKIKSCRDTMSENYENHAKGVNSKVSSVTERLKSHERETESKLLEQSNEIKRGIKRASQPSSGKVKAGQKEQCLSKSEVAEIEKSLLDKLKDYELTKDVNAKIKSCRDTMSENYENHAKGVDSKVLSMTELANKSISNKVRSEVEKAEKSILKKVLSKIS